jgi:peroxiredoxin
VVDEDGIIRYAELVNEIASEPNYDSVMKAVKELV